MTTGDNKRSIAMDGFPPMTLLRQGSPLASPQRQVQILEDRSNATLPFFEERLCQASLSPLQATGVEVLQVNLGKLCNQTCRHCHVDAGPDRRETMSLETINDCLAALWRHDIRTLDITGGAPEMNPSFKYLVREARQLGRRVIDRSNLTILVAAGYEDLPKFLADQRAEVTASLPCYLEENCDKQRGNGVFNRSIDALRRLNAVGYGRTGSGLELSLVYNPVGASLPPSQQALETEYRHALRSLYGVEFTRLYTITNMPISRFLDDLLTSQQYEKYMRMLVQAFNPATVDSVMCRTTLSVGWTGRLFDCDFNQMLDIGLSSELPMHVRDLDSHKLAVRRISTGRHCFGCTAGAGSSCQGSVCEQSVKAAT